MDFQTYRELAMRTAKIFPSRRDNLRHAALGLLTEIGEFTTEVKRMAIYDKPQTEEMRQHMIEEIGDALWYVPLAMAFLGCDSMPDPTIDQLESLPDTLAESCVFMGAMAGGFCASLLASNDFESDEVIQMLSGIVYIVDTKIAPTLHTDGDQIRAQNILKLRKRFPDAYSDAAAEGRADKGGLPAIAS